MKFLTVYFATSHRLGKRLTLLDFGADMRASRLPRNPPQRCQSEGAKPGQKNPDIVSAIIRNLTVIR